MDHLLSLWVYAMPSKHHQSKKCNTLPTAQSFRGNNKYENLYFILKGVLIGFTCSGVYGDMLGAKLRERPKTVKSTIVMVGVDRLDDYYVTAYIHTRSLWKLVFFLLLIFSSIGSRSWFNLALTFDDKQYYYFEELFMIIWKVPPITGQEETNKLNLDRFMILFTDLCNFDVASLGIMKITCFFPHHCWFKQGSFSSVGAFFVIWIVSTAANTWFFFSRLA